MSLQHEAQVVQKVIDVVQARTALSVMPDNLVGSDAQPGQYTHRRFRVNYGETDWEAMPTRRRPGGPMVGVLPVTVTLYHDLNGSVPGASLDTATADARDVRGALQTQHLGLVVTGWGPTANRRTADRVEQDVSVRIVVQDTLPPRSP